MKKNLVITIIVLAVAVSGYFYLSKSRPAFNFRGSSKETGHSVSEALATKFNYLSKNGNSSCAASFKDSIAAKSNDARLQGSCCSAMSIHRYSEQVEGLEKFKSVPDQNISKIPDDPYDVEVGLAKELMSYYDLELSAEEQKAYDYAMQNSSEKGPCCCKCWRWYVYGGLGKYLIKNHNFTGQQVTEVWDLSDGCGGDSEHHH